MRLCEDVRSPGTGDTSRQLCTDMWVLGIEPWSFGRAASALNLRVISPAPWSVTTLTTPLFMQDYKSQI